MLKALSKIVSKEERFTVVGSATNGRQALRYASELAPQLVVMGSKLSNMSGIHAARQIKTALNPPVVFMLNSGEGSKAGAMNQAAGADVFVANFRDLETRLRSSLQKVVSPKPKKSRLARLDAQVYCTCSGRPCGPSASA